MVCSVNKEMTDKSAYEVACEYYGGPFCDGLPGALCGKYMLKMGGNVIKHGCCD
jgi:hypothetical protein